MNILIISSTFLLLAATAVNSAYNRQQQATQNRILIKAVCDKNDDPSAREWWMKRNLLGDDDLEKCKICMDECRRDSQCMGECVSASKIRPAGDVKKDAVFNKEEDGETMTMMRGEQNWSEAAIMALNESSLCAPVMLCRDKNDCRMKQSAGQHMRGEWRRAFDCLRNQCEDELSTCRKCKKAQNVCTTQKCLTPCKKQCRDKCGPQCGN